MGGVTDPLIALREHAVECGERQREVDKQLATLRVRQRLALEQGDDDALSTLVTESREANTMSKELQTEKRQYTEALLNGVRMLRDEPPPSHLQDQLERLEARCTAAESTMDALRSELMCLRERGGVGSPGPPPGGWGVLSPRLEGYFMGSELDMWSKASKESLSLAWPVRLETLRRIPMGVTVASSPRMWNQYAWRIIIKVGSMGGLGVFLNLCPGYLSEGACLPVEFTIGILGGEPPVKHSMVYVFKKTDLDRGYQNLVSTARLLDPSSPHAFPIHDGHCVFVLIENLKLQ